MGLSAQEIHIELDQAVQRLNSKFRDDIQPEEKDWLYNVARLRFIKRRLRPEGDDKKLGFQENIKRYEDLESLIATKSLPLFLLFGEQYRYVGIKPANYLHYVTSEASVLRWCDISKGYSPTNVQSDSYAFKIDYVFGSNYTTQFKIRINGNTVFDVANYPFPMGYFSDVNLKFYLVNLITQAIIDSGYSIYWEKLSSFYIKDNFILDRFVIPSVPFNVEVIVDGNVYNGSQFNVINGQQYVDNRRVKWTNQKTRLYGTQTADRVAGYSFGKTKYNSVILQFENEVVIAHADEKFILNALTMKFYRKPRPIDLYLSVGCELHDTTTLEVIDEAARMYVSRVGSEKVKLLATEQLLNE